MIPTYPVRVVVMGDVIVDETAHVTVTRISPEDDSVLVADYKSLSVSLGGAGNVAANVKAMGVDTALVSSYSDDRVLGLLQVAELSPASVFPVPSITSVKRRYVSQSGRTLLRVDRDVSDGPWETPRALYDSVDHLVFPPNRAFSDPRPILCLVDYGKGFFTKRTLSTIMFKVDQLHESSVMPVIVDPGRTGGWSRFSSPRTIFKANLKQARQVAGRAQQDESPAGLLLTAKLAVLRLNELKVKFHTLVMTCGDKGCVVVNNDNTKSVHLLPAFVPHVSNPCGAGDTFMAAFARTLAWDDRPLSWPVLTNAAKAANYAAGLAVSRPGVAVITEKDLNPDLVAKLESGYPIPVL